MYILYVCRAQLDKEEKEEHQDLKEMVDMMVPMDREEILVYSCHHYCYCFTLDSELLLPFTHLTSVAT